MCKHVYVCMYVCIMSTLHLPALFSITEKKQLCDTCSSNNWCCKKYHIRSLLQNSISLQKSRAKTSTALYTNLVHILLSIVLQDNTYSILYTPIKWLLLLLLLLLLFVLVFILHFHFSLVGRRNILQPLLQHSKSNNNSKGV